MASVKGLFDRARAFRFGIVGISATLAYLMIANLVAVPVGPLSPFAAHVFALAASIGVSYGGHHAYTFRRDGDHGFYMRRFAVITAAIFVLTSAFAFACDRYLRLPAAAISVMVAVLYPALSYVLHSLWTFKARHRAAAD